MNATFWLTAVSVVIHGILAGKQLRRSGREAPDPKAYRGHRVRGFRG
jgi:hypothetical protein